MPLPFLRFVRPAGRSATTLVATLVATVSIVSSARGQDTTSTIHYKGLTLTPVGFAAAELVYRTRNIEADIGSSYNAIPFDNTSEAKLSEFRATGRQSRIGMMGTGKVDDNTATAYWEADFLGVGTTSNSNESNSYVLRIRQYWGSITSADKLTFAGGQMWSLMTMNKTGMLPRSEAVPLTIEAQYAAGFDWARQPGFRLVKTGDMASFGIALEGAQTTFSARNASANVLIGQTGGSLLNGTVNYSTDLAPDGIVKLAFDPKGWGHWELKGIVSDFRDRFVDPTNVLGGTRTSTTSAWGVGGGFYFPVMSGGRDMVDLSLTALTGKGVGRYGTSGFADATIDTAGKLVPIKTSHALVSIEAHPTKMLDVYVYGGAEYADRTAITNAAGKGVGYGSPLNNDAGCTTEAIPGGQYTPASGACSADTRAIWQGNLGFWYRFYKGAAGTVQWGLQASHTVREAWSGVGGEPKGTDDMIFSSFRIVLP